MPDTLVTLKITVGQANVIKTALVNERARLEALIAPMPDTNERETRVAELDDCRRLLVSIG